MPAMNWGGILIFVHGITLYIFGREFLNLAVAESVIF